MKALLEHIGVLLKVLRVMCNDSRDSQKALLLWKSAKVVYSYLQQCEEAIKQDSGMVVMFLLSFYEFF